jgi:phospholipid transport system substrate-binding protein
MAAYNSIRTHAARWCFATTLTLAFAVRAEESPRQLIEATISDAFKVLRAPELKNDPKQRLRKLRDIADRAFDWEAMARSSLGPPWRQLNPVQRTDFVAVFKELLAQRYMDDIDRFQGSEELRISGAEQQAEASIIKTTLTTSSREQIPIDYTLHLAAGRWRVDDISIEGISLVNHYRKTFARFLANKPFEQLLQQLKLKLGAPSPEPASVP